MTTYIAVHRHRHGVDTFLFQSEETYETNWPDDEDIAKQLGIDYEPDREEYIEYRAVDLAHIAIVRNRPEILEANARLIAAAPELLTFAEYVADENHALDFHTVIRMAKAAIAKATIERSETVQP